MSDVNLQMLEGAVGHLSRLLDDVVFVGGVTVELWVTDPGSPPLRLTADVDVIAEISTRQDYYRLEDRVRELGLRTIGRVESSAGLTIPSLDSSSM